MVDSGFELLLMERCIALAVVVVGDEKASAVLKIMAKKQATDRRIDVEEEKDTMVIAD